MAQAMAGVQMGMAMANQMTQSMNNMSGTQGTVNTASGNRPN